MTPEKYARGDLVDIAIGFKHYIGLVLKHDVLEGQLMILWCDGTIEPYFDWFADFEVI